MNKTALEITTEARRTRRFVRNLRALCVSVVALYVLLVTFPAQAEELAPGYWEQSPLPQTGLATYYAPGMMEYVEGYRQTQGQLPACPECVGTVALLRAGDIGRKVWLQQTDGERVGPFLVIDCARRQDVAPLVARDWVVDVSYELGQAWGMNRPLDGVTVLEDPADAGVTPVRLGVPTPFYVPVGEVVISAPTATPAGDRCRADTLANAHPRGHGATRRAGGADHDTSAADPAPAPAADADRHHADPRGHADPGAAGRRKHAHTGVDGPDRNAGGLGH